MKKHISLLLAAVMLLSFSLITHADNNTDEQGLVYFLASDENDTHYVILDCDDSVKKVTIPSAHNGIPVKEIWGSAFANCVNLTDIKIPDTVTTIGKEAFYNCNGLTYIEIPKSVTSIGEGVFNLCEGLDVIEVSDGNAVYHSEGNCIIDTERKRLVLGCKTSIIPSDGSVLEIGNSAFYNCEGLTSIIIPDSVTVIGDYAFYSCNSLTNVTISDSVTSIGDRAFDNCTVLSDIKIPDSLITIGNGAFQTCYALTGITIPGSVKEIGENPFASCYAIDTLEVSKENTVYHSENNCIIETATKTLISGCNNSIIPADGSVTVIGSYAFEGCGELTNVVLPECIVSIGKNAFYVWGSLNVRNIKGGIYLGSENNPCFALLQAEVEGSSFHINDGTKIIADYAFSGNENLTNVEIPDSVISIGEYAFEACPLESVTIPNSVTHLGYGAFGWYALNDNYSFEYTTYGNGLYIGNDENPYVLLFDTVSSSITEIEIHEDTRFINALTFHWCDDLESIHIPASVIHIEADAFNFLISGNLESITVSPGNSVYHSDGNCLIKTETKELVLGCKNSEIPADGSVTAIGANAFYGCDGLRNINIPDTVTTIGELAFMYCSNLREIFIPDSVVSVAEHAFHECTLNITSPFNIYCEVEAKPTGWNDNWYMTFFEENVAVHWGANEDAVRALLGDINSNEEIDSLDYILLKRAYFGTFKLTDTAKTAGDINKNGEIDSLDYILLKRAYFGTYKIN